MWQVNKMYKVFIVTKGCEPLAHDKIEANWGLSLGVEMLKDLIEVKFLATYQNKNELFMVLILKAGNICGGLSIHMISANERSSLLVSTLLKSYKKSASQRNLLAH